MQELTKTDMQFVVSRIPKDVRALMAKYPLILGGGFIRETIAGNRVQDVDLFGPTEDKLRLAAQELCLKRKGRIHETKYALTVIAPPRLPVQFIKRWTCDSMTKLVEEFDFTVCQAAIRVLCTEGEGDEMKIKWSSCRSEGFYPDLAARRLVYTSPKRDEEAGGSFLRMRKFIARGYTIQAASMAAVTARLVTKVRIEEISEYEKPEDREAFIGKVLVGLLREVDPLAIIDGLECLDEHEIIAAEGGA